MDVKGHHQSLHDQLVAARQERSWQTSPAAVVAPASDHRADLRQVPTTSGQHLAAHAHAHGGVVAQSLVIRNLSFHVPRPQPKSLIPAFLKPKKASTADTSAATNEPSQGSSDQQRLLEAPTARPADEITILNDISLTVKAGQVLAILGSSGSGKTSLLDVLACRSPKDGRIEGQVLLNDRPMTAAAMRDVAGYVVQDDRLLPNLTVHETLMYVALLRLPPSMSHEQRMARVTSVIAELGLRSVSNTRIGGGHIRGVSGGERRRVSIAVQLLTDPYLLILDEPTTGLDSFSAANIVSVLSQLAAANRTVLFTIHQPRSDVFDLFDRILLLSKGRTMYCGPSKHMVSWFKAQGHECPKFSNPCDFSLDLATVDYRTHDAEKESMQRVLSLSKAFEERSRDFFAAVDPNELENWKHGARAGQSGELNSVMAINDGPVLAVSKPRQRISRARQMYILYLRASRNILQGTGQLAGELVSTLFMAFLLGCIFYKLGDDQISVRDRFGLFYIACSLFPFMVILDTIAKFDSERASFYNERQDGMYDLLPYYLAKVLAELPFNVFFSVVYLIPIYFMANLKSDAASFFIFGSVLFLVVYCSRSLAMVMAAAFPVFQAACFAANLVFTLFILSSGFLINLDTIWAGVSWFAHVSYIRLGFEALSITEFSGMNFTCANVSTSVVDPVFLSSEVNLGQNGSASCPIPNGKAALESFALTDATFAQSVYALVILVVGFRTLAYGFLRFVHQKPRDK
ncbi:hypothetical protein CAOG_06121 [Capsaspora owczarzaki ATCC 30864]|uniref:ABC transporter domain-containing protein n=1 Tax=Capsaspora owczarzaki (strain ATCC 30864) TaxID=595528 RepID=A0A0D2UKU9_CAPO3|nr:hypothetical protein CAOG_06121 [Capsaspora owczarzaki ATCC 30864]KJE95696.1 hypothetical protein CAOG_006121 [Capsaspora owczarzaki ATCC 30864]|eukprot:XP_004345711.1 hypothetical protein CAOG_06121 [Capsaspora owczarzaki ATCC 30864]